MKYVFALLTVSSFIFCSFKPATKSTWTLDKSHSKLSFSITHLLVSDAEGNFKNIEAKITAPNDDFTDAEVELTADVNSIETGNDSRNEHLKKDDYFDVAKYPTLTFKSTSFKKVKENTYLVIGNLTMHGVTKPIELNVTTRLGVHPKTNKTIAGFKLSGTLQRSDYKLAPKTPTTILGDEVQITANTEFSKN